MGSYPISLEVHVRDSDFTLLLRVRTTAWSLLCHTRHKSSFE